MIGFEEGIDKAVPSSEDPLPLQLFSNGKRLYEFTSNIAGNPTELKLFYDEILSVDVEDVRV